MFGEEDEEEENEAAEEGGKSQAGMHSISGSKLWRLFSNKSTPDIGKNVAVSPLVPAPVKPKEEKLLSCSSSMFDPSKIHHHYTPSPPASSYQPPGLNPIPDLSHAAFIYNTPTYIMTPWQFSGGYLTGRLKFFDETQQYGFFILDSDGTDLFVHYDDLVKSGITLVVLQQAKIQDYHFAFQCMSYYGKYQLSRKAINIHLVNDGKYMTKERTTLL